MAALDFVRPAADGPALTAWVASVAGNLSSWNDARVTRKSLSALTDRQLDDIGLTRGDVINL